MLKSRSFFRGGPKVKDDDFGLESVSSVDNEESLLAGDEEEQDNDDSPFEKIIKPMTFQDKQIWYLRAIFFLLLVMVGLLIAVLVATIIFVPVVTSSNQFERAIRVIDQVYAMKDLTQNMADVTTNTQHNVEKAMLDYDVSGIINSVKKITQRTGELLALVQPDTFAQASSTGAKLVDTLQKLDMEEGKQLIRNANRWTTTLDPAKVATGIEEANAFMHKTTATLQRVEDSRVVETVQQFASGAIELEDRLKRLNEITLKFPTTP